MSDELRRHRTDGFPGSARIHGMGRSRVNATGGDIWDVITSDMAEEKDRRVCSERE